MTEATGPKPKPGFNGFICEVSGERVSAAECLECAFRGAPGCNIGSPAIISGIVDGMRPVGFAFQEASEERPDLEFDQAFTATELLGCQRKRELQGMYPWWDKPSSLYWAYRGNLMHKQAEAYAQKNPYALAEGRLFWSLRYQGTVVGLSGAPDLLIFSPAQRGWVIVDYKTIKTIRRWMYRHTCKATGQVITDMPFRVNGKGLECPWCGTHHDKEDLDIHRVEFQARGTHQEQIQLYTLLVEKNAPQLAAAVNRRLAEAGISDRVPEAAPVVEAELVYMDMAQTLRRPVEIWPRADRIAFLKEKLRSALAPGLPPVLSDPRQTWQCRYCPVADICERLADDDAPDETPAQKEARIMTELGF